jgi:hypothetical protein
VEATASDPGWKRVCGLLALFAIVYGARLWIADVCGSPAPFWDQWDAEGRGLFGRFVRGELSLSHFFQPHNEHRIVLTRLLALGLLQINGMWDPRLEMVVNAAIAAGSATLIAHLLLLEIGAKWWRPVISAVALLWALPYGFENTVWGFQSQVYFLILFSFLALWGLAYGPPYSTRWWIGIASAVLACLTMASGFLAGLVVVATRCLAIALDRRTWRTHWLTLLVCLVCAAVSLLLTPHVPRHEELHAQGLLCFLRSLFKSLSWPAIRQPMAFLLFQVPLFANARALLQGKSPQPARWFLLGLTIWAVLKAGILAYGRGGLGGAPISRYQDPLAIGFLASFVALLLEWPRINRWIRYGWILLALVGLIQSASHDLRKSLPHQRQHMLEQVRRCLSYVESHDPSVLSASLHFLDIPYPNPDTLRRYLDDPQLRKILLFIPGQEGNARWPTQIAKCLLKGSRGILLLGILGLCSILLPKRGH